MSFLGFPNWKSRGFSHIFPPFFHIFLHFPTFFHIFPSASPRFPAVAPRSWPAASPPSPARPAAAWAAPCCRRWCERPRRSGRRSNWSTCLGSEGSHLTVMENQINKDHFITGNPKIFFNPISYDLYIYIIYILSHINHEYLRINWKR